MRKTTHFIITDIIKNKIIIIYTVILALFSWSVLSLEDNTAKAMLSLLNIILLAVPLMSLIFSTIYMYNSSEFIELLVSQPIKRKTIWFSHFAGLTVSLSIAFIIGIGIPILIFSPNAAGFSILLMGLFITPIFIAIAMLCSILARDKARGIGIAIMVWLFLTLIYDGIVLYLMFQFADYPIEKPMVVLSALNPIDLARIMVLLKVDVSALMGYTGAIFKQMFGSRLGWVMSLGLLTIWIALPIWISMLKFNRKDL